MQPHTIRTKKLGDLWLGGIPALNISVIGGTEADVIQGVKDALATHKIKPKAQA